LKLLSVNVSLQKTVSDKGKRISTGIFKEPAKGPISVKKLNLAGDEQADRKFHGGVCKAVYAYPFEHYERWAQELKRQELTYGQFGENLTVTALLEENVFIGDHLRVGSALFEVTQPRVPCFKLGIKMGGLSEFPRQFLKSGLVGFYLRVLEEGTIAANEPIEHIRVDSESMSITDIHVAMHFDKHNLVLARKAHAIEALAPGWCRKFESRLTAAGESFEARVHPLESDCCVSL